MQKEEQIVQFLRENLIQIKKTVPKEFPLQDQFREQWGMDSMDLIELVARIEHRYRMVIPDEDIKTFTTLQRITDYLMQKQSNLE
jgi:acyl carrier protein